MIYKKQAIKELAVYSVIIFLILLAVLFSIQFINLLGQVGRGNMSFDLFGSALGVATMGFMPLLLCTTCFIAVLTVFTRYWKDSAMVVWLSNGLSLSRWISPVLAVTVPFVILLLLLTLFLIPKVHEKNTQYVDFLRSQPTLNFLEPGVFIPVPGGVIFIDKFETHSRKITGFFSHIVNKETGKLELTLAREGKVALGSSGVKITLQGIKRYLGRPTEADFTVFTIPNVHYSLAKNQQANNSQGLYDRRHELPTLTLWHSKDRILKSELMWRLSLPIATLLLACLAIVLSYVGTRSVRNYNLVIALLIFFFYQNGLILMRSLIARGTVGFWGGVLIMPTILALAVIFLFYYRQWPQGGFSCLFKNQGRLKE